MSVARTALSMVAALIALVALAAGCGSSGNSGSGTSTEGPATATATTPAAPPGASVKSCRVAAAGIAQVRVTGIGCAAARSVATAWTDERGCFQPRGASRYSCAVRGGYRCIGATTERGIAVSCARPGRSLAFVAKGG
jgi:hypothetical protein